MHCLADDIARLESATAATFCEGRSTEIAAIYEQIYLTPGLQLTYKLWTVLIGSCLTLALSIEQYSSEICRHSDDECLWAVTWPRLSRTAQKLGVMEKAYAVVDFDGRSSRVRLTPRVFSFCRKASICKQIRSRRQCGPLDANRFNALSWMLEPLPLFSVSHIEPAS